MTSADVRGQLGDAPRLDFVGPELDDAVHAEEVLPTSPSQGYRSGFLVPFAAPDNQRGGEDTDEQLDLLERPGAPCKAWDTNLEELLAKGPITQGLIGAL